MKRRTRHTEAAIRWHGASPSCCRAGQPMSSVTEPAHPPTGASRVGRWLAKRSGRRAASRTLRRSWFHLERFELERDVREIIENTRTLILFLEQGLDAPGGTLTGWDAAETSLNDALRSYRELYGEDNPTAHELQESLDALLEARNLTTRRQDREPPIVRGIRLTSSSLGGAINILYDGEVVQGISVAEPALSWSSPDWESASRLGPLLLVRLGDPLRPEACVL